MVAAATAATASLDGTRVAPGGQVARVPEDLAAPAPEVHRRVDPVRVALAVKDRVPAVLADPVRVARVPAVSVALPGQVPRAVMQQD